MQEKQPASWQGKTLGRYELLHLIGTGGMGEVWLANDHKLRRQVAVKLLPAVMAGNEEYLQAFAYEAQAAAALTHPHILPVHDFGQEQTPEGQVVPYLVLQYVSGGSLRDRIRRTPLLPPPLILSLLRQAAEAIDYAHSRQVLHRDIKPANMLLEKDWLFLTDFGIAKLLNSPLQREHTQSGAGTPEYMAPEQVRGRAQVASDRYSFAMIAYQLLTGRLPFRGDSPYEVLMKQLTSQLPSPRQYNTTLPLAVERILQLALSKNPNERPPTCIAFVEALQNSWGAATSNLTASQPLPSSPLVTAPTPSSLISGNEHIHSGSFNPSHQSGTFPQASSPVYSPVPQTLMAQSGSQPASLTTPVTSFPDTSNITTHIPNAQKTSRLNRRTLLIGGAATAGLLATGSAFAATQWLNPHSDKNQMATPTVPAAPQAVNSVTPLLALAGHNNFVNAVRWDPTGRYLVSAGKDTWVMVWDLASYLKKNQKGFQTITDPLASWKFQDEITSGGVNWSHDSHYLAVVPNTTKQIYVIDTLKQNSTPQEYTDESQKNTVLGPPIYQYAAWSPNDNTFVTGMFEQQNLLFWSLNKRTIPTRTLHYGPAIQIPSGLSDIDWSHDGKYIAALTNNYHALVWEAETGKVLQDLALPSRSKKDFTIVGRYALQWAMHDSSKLIVSDIDIATIWDVQHNKLLFSLGTDDPDPTTPPKENPVGWVPHTNGLCWSPSGRYILGSFGRSHKMYLWDLQDPSPHQKNGIRMQTFIFGDTGAHGDTITDTSWSPDGRYLATASYDHTVIIWQVKGS